MLIEIDFNEHFCIYEKCKKRCWACGFIDSIRWGIQAGKQRYKCKNCGIFFTTENTAVSKSNRFIWFKKWVVDRYTVTELSQASGYSTRTLKRYFHDYLEDPPVLSVFPSERVNLLIDGTYFNNDLCLILYRDNTIKFTQLYRLTDGEWYEELAEDLANLLKLGVQIESITCDGHKALLKAVKHICPEVMLQRCVVHVQRMCRIWLSNRPKTDAGRELRQIISKVHTITSSIERDYWLVSLIQWYEKYKSFINQKSINPLTGRYWYTHKMVRRSFMVIKNALPHMFHYLQNERIPKSTNGLESFFGHLKGHLNVHRGLSHQHRRQFIQWYLYFKNKK
jgi:AraC-like DNA-binding protein